MQQAIRELYEMGRRDSVKNPAYRTQVPYGLWRTRTLEILQTVFTPMYKNIWQNNWNNSVYATMTQPYYYCNWEEGIYEIYIPTTIDGLNRMHYWRICVKVYNQLDKETIEQNQPNLQTPFVKPIGIIDSETVCHMAQQTTPEHQHKLKCLWKQGGRKAWFKGLLRGFKHLNKRGYFTPIIIHQSPDIAVKRLLSLIYNFMKTRITQLLKKLKLQTWMFEEYLIKRQNNSLLILIEQYSVTLRTIVKGFLESFDWIKMKLKDLFAEIGRQSVQKTKIQPLIKEIRSIIQVFRAKNSLRNPDVPDPPIIKELVSVAKGG